VFQEPSFPALDEELTLLEVSRKENKDSTANSGRFRKGDSHQLKEVAHDMELPSESSGSCREAMAMHEQLPSFATGFKADASSSSGDLYNAYKAPEEKQKDVSYPDASTVAVPVVNEKAFANDFEKESQKEF
jgi:hypothetical protein